MYLCGGFMRRAAGNDEHAHFPCALSAAMTKAAEAGRILSPETVGFKYFTEVCSKIV
jgi:hypothetical protein